MTTKIIIHHKILLRNGNCIVEINDAKMETTYENPKLANETFKLMQKQKKKSIELKGKTIIETHKGKTEQELTKIVLAELDAAKKSRIPGRKLSYVVYTKKKENEKRKPTKRKGNSGSTSKSVKPKKIHARN